MTAVRLTASGLWRSEPCPASAVLPAVSRRYKDADAGAEEHKRLEETAPAGSIAEAKFAFNVLSGEARFIGQGSDRDYGPLAEGEIPGTADVLFVRDDHLLMQDYKTANGYAEQLAGVFDKPKENLQFGHNALCASLVHDKPKVFFEALYTKTGEVKDAAFDSFDFAAIAQRLARIWRRCGQAAVMVGTPELIWLGLVAEGPWCWRCSAAKACPLKKKRAA